MIFTKREDQYWATRVDWKDMADIIKEKWDEGYAITDICHGDGVYYALLEKDTGILAQGYEWNKSLSKSLEEKKEGSDSMCITSFFCDDGSSCVVRSKFKNSIDQRWCRSAVFPKKEIEKHWKDGYAISAMNWKNEHWLILFSKGIDYAHKESWETTFKPKPYKLSKMLRRDAKIVSSLCFGDGKWAFTYARHPRVFGQKIYMGKDFPDKEITELWNENYDISKAAWGNGFWFLTFTSSYQADFNMHDRFQKLYRAKKYNEATLFFKEYLYENFGSPDPIILNYLQCFKRLKKYEEGIEAFEYFNTLFSTYHEALHIGGDLYFLAFKQKRSEAYLRKALKCFSLISPASSAIRKKMKELGSLLKDNGGSDTEWKRKMARKEQAKRKRDREEKNEKF